MDILGGEDDGGEQRAEHPRVGPAQALKQPAEQARPSHQRQQAAAVNGRIFAKRAAIVHAVHTKN